MSYPEYRPVGNAIAFALTGRENVAECARRRRREVAERMHGVELTNSIFVPAGGSCDDAVPMETLSAAA